MPSTELEGLWKDPSHWNRDGTYNCAADPRLWVQKRVGAGWTINVGHPRGVATYWGFIVGLTAFVVAIVALAGGLRIAALTAGAFVLLIGGILAVERLAEWRDKRGHHRAT